VLAHVADEPGSYRIAWGLYDNASGATTGISETTTVERQASLTRLPDTTGVLVQVDVSAVSPAHQSWSLPIHAYFRRTGNGWTLVGLDRSAR